MHHRAIEYLEKCELLRIEDILPFFPDFVRIDEFKQEICQALEKYKAYTAQLYQEMNASANSAELLRLDLRALKRRFLSLPSNSRCQVCQLSLFVRQSNNKSLAFPCRHCFHYDCLLTVLLRDYFSPAQQRRVIHLQEAVEREKILLSNDQSIPLLGYSGDRSSGTTDRSSGLFQKYSQELEDLVGADCALCGDYIIQTIDRPFVDEYKESVLIEQWCL